MKLLNEYLREIYGCKVYKLSLQAQVTCPNRDGTLDSRGCIFCSVASPAGDTLKSFKAATGSHYQRAWTGSAGGSGEFAANRNKPIPEQLIEAKQRVSAKIKGDAKYIAYFQSFTNTYGDIEYLEKVYRQAMEPEDVVILSIATRPDCISDEMYELLASLNRIKPVWIELGLQTIHQRTADYIRRGYELPVYDECVRKLKELGISVITHVILGLPGESKEDMKETVRYVVSFGIQGIKLQLLHVLKGTDLCTAYERGEVPVMSMEEYIDLLKEIMPLIPDDVVIHRLTGDGPKKLLVAPLWSGNKKRIINVIHKEIIR